MVFYFYFNSVSVPLSFIWLPWFLPEARTTWRGVICNCLQRNLQVCIVCRTICCHWMFWHLYNVPDYYSQVWGKKPEFSNDSLTWSTHENETFENVQRVSARNSNLVFLNFLTVLCLKNFEFGIKRSWKGSNFHHKKMKLTFCVLALHRPKPGWNAAILSVLQIWELRLFDKTEW